VNEDQEDKKVSLSGRLHAMCHANPRRVVVVAVAVAAAAGLVIALLGQFGNSWQQYQLTAIDLAVELPAEPVAEPAGLEGEAGVTYRANIPDLAVLVNGGRIAAGTRIQKDFMVEQAMNFVRVGKDIRDLKYQVTARRIHGQSCLHVSGTFLIGDTPARLSGVFFADSTHHAHVICFYSTSKGAEAGRRVLASIRFTNS
jgi:hypothetical protein